MSFILRECAACGEMWIGACWSCATDCSDDFVGCDAEGGRFWIDTGADATLHPTWDPLDLRPTSIANFSAQEGERILANACASTEWRRCRIIDTPASRVNRGRHAAYLRVSHVRFHIFMKMSKSRRNQPYPNSSPGPSIEPEFVSSPRSVGLFETLSLWILWAARLSHLLCRYMGSSLAYLFRMCMSIFAHRIGSMADQVGNSTRNVFGRGPSWSVNPPLPRVSRETNSDWPTLSHGNPISIRRSSRLSTKVRMPSRSRSNLASSSRGIQSALPPVCCSEFATSSRDEGVLQMLPEWITWAARLLRLFCGYVSSAFVCLARISTSVVAHRIRLRVDQVGNSACCVSGREASVSITPPLSRMGPEASKYEPTLSRDYPLSLRAGANKRRAHSDGLPLGSGDAKGDLSSERNTKDRKLNVDRRPRAPIILLSPDDEDVARGSRDIPPRDLGDTVKTDAANGRHIANIGALMGEMALGASPPRDVGGGARPIAPSSSLIADSNDGVDGSGQEKELVFRSPITYGTQNSYGKWYSPARSTVAEESSPQSSLIGAGNGTRALKLEHFEIRHNKPSDGRCDAKSQGDTDRPCNYKSPPKDDFDSLSVSGRSDRNWDIAGNKFSAVDIFS